MRYSLLPSVLLSMCLLAVVFSAEAQDEKFKAIFIYNFTKYINWPAYQGDFVIDVLGNGDIINEIEGIASKKTVGNNRIETKRINSVAEIDVCHILYVTSGKTDLLPEVFSIAKRKNILLITEKSNACKGGSGINFISRDGKLTFEISKSNINACGLEISSDLLKLGTGSNN